MTARYLSNTKKTTFGLNAWNGEGVHPHMLASDPWSDKSKDLSRARTAGILKEYLTYDNAETEQMHAFIATYPWVLEDAYVCLSVVSDPKCYATLKKYQWWDQAVGNVETSDNLTGIWLKEHHVVALAYETSDTELERLIDWPAWEILIQEHGPMCQYYDGDSCDFSRTRAFVALANRLGTDLAPLMCAAMHILLPFDALQSIIGDAWTPLQKAQFAWLIDKTGIVSDIWPTTNSGNLVIRQAQEDVKQWAVLVDPKELDGTAAVYDLNSANVADTIYSLIQFAQCPAPTESLDYTMAIEASFL